MKAGVKMVYNAFTKTANGYQVSLYFTYTATETFYLVKNCWATANRST